MAGLSELDTLRTYPEWGREWRVFYDVPQEKLPAGAVAIAHRIDVRHLLPLLVEHHRLRPFWVEERLRCGDQRLDEAAVQAAHSRTSDPIDLDLQEIVALDPARPGRTHLCQHTARQLEYREGRILHIDLVRVAGFIAALGSAVMCRQDTAWISPS